VQKIVVSWSYSDYECSGEVVECVLYESIEAFYCDFEAKVKEFLDGREKWFEELKKHQTAVDKISKRDRDYHKKVAEIKSPKWDYPSTFQLAGKEWDSNNFIYRERDDWETKREVKLAVSLPTIQTLEEWFDAKVSV
jgi:hypothetical protein